MILKAIFGRKKIKTSSPSAESKVIDLFEKRNQYVEKQLANCMKEIQQLMSRQKQALSTPPKIKVILKPVV